MRADDMILYNVKVPEDLKQAFLRTCEQNDTTGAREIRRFMMDYIRKNGQKDLFKDK